RAPRRRPSRRRAARVPARRESRRDGPVPQARGASLDPGHRALRRRDEGARALHRGASGLGRGGPGSCGKSMAHSQPSLSPTDDPQINAVLSEVLSGALGILGDHFVGMYLDSSLAIGDFEPDKSDLDFVVVTSADVSADTFAALKMMHDRIASGDSK